MPRNTTQPVIKLALSPSQAALALGIHPQRVADAILQGKLTVRQIGTKRRIACAEICEWFESFPVAARKVPRKC